MASTPSEVPVDPHAVTSPSNATAIPVIGDKPLTIRLKTPECHTEKSPPISPSILLSPSLKISPDSSRLNSPSLVSPPSSAFVSALQSPYISPRAHLPAENPQQSPVSHSGSHSDDIPSSSYTPPPEKTDFSDDLTDQKPRFSACIADPMPPRISFSFPVPRVSFTKGSASPPQSAKLRSCDVYIGYHGQNSNLVRFCRWLKSELELQGIACFLADRARYSDTQSLEIADRIICSATYGVVVVTGSIFLNPFSMEELRIFNQKKNLIPLLFETDVEEVTSFLDQRFDEKQRICKVQEKEWREMIEALLRSHEFKLEACDSTWRNCVARTVGILKSKLGRKSVTEKDVDVEEFPYPRNRNFVGREKELQDMELSFFGSTEYDESKYVKMGFRGGSEELLDGFADEESDTVKTRGRFINLEMRKCKEPTLEAWIEPVVELANRGRSPQKQRHKQKKSRHGGKNSGRLDSGFHQCGTGNVVCLTGGTGLGKTELALEFAYRYAQRYKMVLWVGGESRFFRQNIMNLSAKLGLDVSAETQHERGRIRSFEEQELDAFQRVRRELFRDVPYLLIIDNLESEKEWWDAKDLHDLIPRITGATHVLITTRLSKVLSFEHMQVPPLPMANVMVLMKGKRKKDYPSEELDILRKFHDKLGQSSFGLGVVACLLFELAMSPSSLFEAINKLPLVEYADDSASCSPIASEDQFFKNNQFLMKTLSFCYTILCQFSGGRNLASRMVLAGAWFAPSPISANLLAASAKNIPESGKSFDHWKKYLAMAVCSSSQCFMGPQARRSEAEAALLIVKLGLARRCNKQLGCSIQFHDITRLFARRRVGLTAAKATVQGVKKIGNPVLNSDHLWAAAFLVLGFKSEPMLVQLNAIDLVLFIRRVAIPLALRSFSVFSRCNASLELLKLCTNVLEDVEKSFVSQIQDWCHGSFCWRKKNQSKHSVDEYVWQDVTLLKATLLETRAKLLLRGGQFDTGEELCRTCISIRTVMLGHHHAQTLAAQETLAKLVRFRSKI
ncbi:uncharacterized protein LOC116249525 [Nymphaea colorata]|uniref:TIR domain-containing protein n=1 Tax=Nymphaea colorata TaxID=210225 RepID=A0A5K1C592_9MAGN|nr:uncharacterized protein LOC116249525 [Nymphaea colorata]